MASALIRLSSPAISSISNLKCNEQLFDLITELQKGLAAVSDALLFTFRFDSGRTTELQCWEKARYHMVLSGKLCQTTRESGYLDWDLSSSPRQSCDFE